MTDRVVVPFVPRVVTKSEVVRKLATEKGIPFIDFPPRDTSGSIANDDIGATADSLASRFLSYNDDLAATADSLASRFLEAGYADLLRGIQHREALESATLALMIYTRLPSDEQDNFFALLRRSTD